MGGLAGVEKIPLAPRRPPVAEVRDHVTQSPFGYTCVGGNFRDSEQAVIAFTVIGVHWGKITVSADRNANVKGGDVRSQVHHAGLVGTAIF